MAAVTVEEIGGGISVRVRETRPRHGRRSVERAPCALPRRDARGPLRTAGRPELVLVPVSAVRRPVRLTRRGRLVVTLVLLVATAAGLATIARGVAAAPRVAPRPATHVVVVRPGETVWSVAARVAPTKDPRATVARIEQINHLAGDTVTAGQALLVPGIGK